MSQFNYTKAKINGFSGLSEFAMGIKNAHHRQMSWKGIRGDKSFAELQRDLFDYNYETFSSFFGHWNDHLGGIEAELGFLLPYGFCLKWRLTKHKMTIRFAGRGAVFMIDQTFTNQLNLLGSQSAMVNLGSLGNGFYSGYKYEVDLSLHDSRIHDGITCVDYDKISSSYGQCIEGKMKEMMLEELGCLLPWVSSTSNLSCENFNSKKISNVMFKEIPNFISGWKMRSLSACKQPCLKLDFKFHEVGHVFNRIDTGYVQMSVYDEVTVYRDVHAFDVFSLVVDLGSALGLWLGLSALTMFTSAVDFINIARKRCFH